MHWRTLETTWPKVQFEDGSRHGRPDPTLDIRVLLSCLFTRTKNVISPYVPLSQPPESWAPPPSASVLSVTSMTELSHGYFRRRGTHSLRDLAVRGQTKPKPKLLGTVCSLYLRLDTIDRSPRHQ
ncbi:hypothetical protein DOTSEDRAFT_70476 [Dothistroma septosporum NZE10]|uniref:Uncharacterized protein n=1 Tax=Dothistroma septosporum (strain NZE10 / CBS 128990) TaxID=675120 RepID=N1PSX8_DOTSN|nr:hypothetical protein DOTSEDRAFT_70476 [Dothistroma septosporum NZE10]